MTDKENAIDIVRDSEYVSVYRANENSDTLMSLCDFFQYKVANEKDSPLSLKLDSLLTDLEKDALFARLLNKAGIAESELIFDSILKNRITDIRAMGLSDTTLKSDRIKGFFHRTNATASRKQQHKIDSLFKHIRDSFAHGRIAFVDSFWILEDKKIQMTARLVITVDVLQEWKNEVERFLAERKQNVSAEQIQEE